VLGLLIWTSYGVYTTQRTAVQTFASHVLQLDIALAELAPDASPARAALRNEIVRTHDEFWGNANADFVARNYSASRANMEARRRFLAELHPANDAQKQALTTAQLETTTIWQTRLMMSFQLDDPVSWPLLTIVVSWTLLLFCGFGVHEPDDLGGDRIRRHRRGERRLSDRRPVRTLFRALPRFSHGPGTCDRGFGKIGGRNPPRGAGYLSCYGGGCFLVCAPFAFIARTMAARASSIALGAAAARTSISSASCQWASACFEAIELLDPAPKSPFQMGKNDDLAWRDCSVERVVCQQSKDDNGKHNEHDQNATRTGPLLLGRIGGRGSHDSLHPETRPHIVRLTDR
jgi:hypothetical protein